MGHIIRHYGALTTHGSYLKRKPEIQSNSSGKMPFSLTSERRKEAWPNCKGIARLLKGRERSDFWKYTLLSSFQNPHFAIGERDFRVLALHRCLPTHSSFILVFLIRRFNWSIVYLFVVNRLIIDNFRDSAHLLPQCRCRLAPVEWN